jgi:hypothetical protein
MGKERRRRRGGQRGEGDLAKERERSDDQGLDGETFDRDDPVREHGPREGDATFTSPIAHVYRGGG